MPGFIPNTWQFVSYRDIRHYIAGIVNGIVGKIWSQMRQCTCQIATFGWLSQTKLLFLVYFVAAAGRKCSQSFILDLNHVRWRFANCRVAIVAASRASSKVSCP